MNIAFFISSLACGGAERATVVLAEYLVNNGHSVSVITNYTQDKDFYSLNPKIERFALGLTSHNVGLKKAFANIERIKALRSIVKIEKPDVLIGVMDGAAILSILACLGFQTKVVAAERNYPGYKKLPFIWGILRRFLYRFADGHVAQTRETAEWLKQNTNASNVKVIPNSVKWPLAQHEPFLPPEKIISEKKRVILAVGTKPYQKGFDLLISAFGCLNHVEDWHLVIVGIDPINEPTIKNLKDLIKSYGCENKVHFPGQVGNMKDWYERADIFVLSSRYEGFPNVLMEAMAAGCACISFDCNTGPRDIINDGFDGLLVPVENVGLLSDSLRNLMLKNDLRKSLSKNAGNVCKKFSEDTICSKWELALSNIF